MYTDIHTLKTVEKFPSALEEDFNFFSAKTTWIISTLSWGMRCGIPLDKALLTLRKSKYRETIMSKAFIWEKAMLWDRNITRAADDLKNGFPLCEAVKHLKRYFPPYVQSAIREAERNKVLDEVLPMMARQMRYSSGVYKERLAGFAYPLFQFIASFGVILFIGTFILPRFNRIFSEFYEGYPVPKITQIVINISEIFPYLFILLVITVPYYFVFRFFYRFEPFARITADFFLLPIPFIGRDMKKMALLEFAGSMASFTAAGIDVIEAAELSRETMSAFWFRKRIDRFIEEIKNGKKWVEAWENLNQEFPFYNWIARNSASREQLPEGFMQMMKWLKSEISTFSLVFIKLIEILGIFLNAVFVGSIVLGLGYGLFHFIYMMADGALK